MNASLRPSGLAGKLFAGALATAVPPLVLALVASVAVYMEQSRLVGAEIVTEKASFALLLFEERKDRLAKFLETTARESSLVVNQELGLHQARDRYLSGLEFSEGLSRLQVDPPESLPSNNDTVEFSVAGRTELAARIPLSSATGRRLGTLSASLNLQLLLDRIAEELDTGVLLLDPDGGVLLFTGGNPADGLRLPASWGQNPEPEPDSGLFSGEQALLAASRLGIGDRTFWLAVAYPVGLLERIYGRGLAVLALAVIAALLLAGAVTFYFVRTIARPASRLAETSLSIARGHFGLTSGIRQNDEIGDIARELDSLSYTLLSQKQERDTAEEALRQSELQFRSIFEGVNEAILVYDPATGRPTDVNAAALNLFGLGKQELLGDSQDLINANDAGSNRWTFTELLARAYSGEILRTEWRSRHSSGRIFWTELSLRSAWIGHETRILASCRDIDERKKTEEDRARSLREKETLLREVHHRVKNNFQIINSLFSLQEAACDEEHLASALREPRERIHAMAMIHDRLYGSANLEALDFGAYVTDLAEELFIAYSTDRAKVALEIDVQPLNVHMDQAIPSGLILNELLTNALKYAFPAGLDRPGRLSVSLTSSGDEAVLVVADDGIGFPAQRQPTGRASLGLTLVEAISRQLRGSIRIDGSAGTRAELRFSLLRRNL